MRDLRYNAWYKGEVFIEKEFSMNNSKMVSAPNAGLVAPYNQIPDYKPGMVLPDIFTILYNRLSKDDKTKGKNDDSDSIVNQKLFNAKFAQDNQVPNPIHFTDDGISGTTFNRPDIQAALEFVEAGRVPCFVCKDLSRFGRDRLTVDRYVEIVFPDLDVRFVAINDNIDTSKGENDMTPLRSLFNEWYARDTSRKVRAVKRAKGLSGERISSHAVYGYLKDPENKKKLVVDEVAAEVVKKIFTMCLGGFGVTHIANKLREEQIFTPANHFTSMGIKTVKKPSSIPYDWEAGTVVDILSRREYLGHTVNFKTTVKSFKNKKTVYNAPENQAIFENTHPAIIDQDTFDRVQVIREGRQRRTKSNEIGLFSGLAYCVDCGSRLGFTASHNPSFYACSGFRKKSVICHHSHYISTAMLERLVSAYLEQVKDFAIKHEKAFANHIMQGAESKSRKALLADKMRLVTMQSRVRELDKYIQRLYEDNVNGKLPFERFTKMSEVYEAEQKALEEEARNLSRKIDEHEKQSVNAEQFLRVVRKYANATELTPIMLHELVEKVEVHAPNKSSGKRVQEITIHLSFIGDIGKLDLLKADSVGSSEIRIEDSKESRMALIPCYSPALSF